MSLKQAQTRPQHGHEPRFPRCSDATSSKSSKSGIDGPVDHMLSVQMQNASSSFKKHLDNCPPGHRGTFLECPHTPLHRQGSITANMHNAATDTASTQQQQRAHGTRTFLSPASTRMSSRLPFSMNGNTMAWNG